MYQLLYFHCHRPKIYMLDHIKLQLKSLTTCKTELLNRVFRIICDPVPNPLEEGMAVHSNILAWRILMDRGAWRAAVHGVAKSPTRLTN